MIKKIKKPNLFLISKGNAKFIINDKQAFRSYYNINEFIYPDKPGIVNIWYLFKLLCYCLFHIPQSNIVYLWFADFHTIIPAALSKLLNTRLILVVGGYDAAKIPELSYGAHINKIRSWCIKWTCYFATNIHPVSKFIDQKLKENVDKTLSTNIIYNGLPVRTPKVNSFKSKKYICTICPGSKVYRYKLKGIDIFLKAAQELSEYPFLIIGTNGPLLHKIKENSSSNVELIPKLEHEQYLKKLKNIRVICQFSRFEAFGISFAESMQYGAFPLASINTGPAELVPNSPIYKVNIKDKHEVTQKTHNAYNSHKDPRYFQEHINNNFNLKDRIDNIMKVIEDE